jgi:hypothetical protein
MGTRYMAVQKRTMVFLLANLYGKFSTELELGEGTRFFRKVGTICQSAQRNIDKSSISSGPLAAAFVFECYLLIKCTVLLEQ